MRGSDIIWVFVHRIISLPYEDENQAVIKEVSPKKTILRTAPSYR